MERVKKGNAILIINYPNDESTSIFKYMQKDYSYLIEIHFCKIDVESSEKDTLLWFYFFNYRPKVFCIESVVTDDPEKKIYKEWEYILTNNEYNFA